MKINNNYTSYLQNFRRNVEKNMVSFEIFTISQIRMEYFNVRESFRCQQSDIGMNKLSINK